MSWRTDDDKFKKPKEVEPSVTDIINNSEYWNKRRLNYLGDDIYFDQEIRTGVCYFCKKDGRTQKSQRTNLHHVKYDHSNKLDWTIEVCSSCHWQIDSKNRKAIAKRTGREISVSYGEYYLNKQQRKENEEQEKRDWWKKYCMNLSGGWVPMEKYIPNQEIYEKVEKAIKEEKSVYKKEKTTSKKETMSNTSRRYF
jgi:ribosomal protein L28